MNLILKEIAVNRKIFIMLLIGFVLTILPILIAISTRDYYDEKFYERKNGYFKYYYSIHLTSKGELSFSEIRRNRVHKTRNEIIGFIFQYFALLKEHTVLDNVALPLTYRKLKQRERENKAKFYLEKVGLKEQMHKTPDELSGGQQQRVAIARALVGEPELILADEPTGNLDRKTGEEIMNLLLQLNEEGRTIIIVTHDIEVANQCNRIIELVDGEVVQS
ncbi:MULTISPECIES: ATP-binding cassette domain-containing protein [Bacillus cereus group]|uniref:ABC transporter ATP-binding protein n=1 Tax=Bacillus cereus group TaxID=86661 RepID=UPI00307CD242